MDNIFSISKDLVISGIIAVLTANLIALPNLVYQIIIAALILLVLFLTLRRLDKLAKRLEILSIIYSESFLRPLLQSLEKNPNITGSDQNVRQIKIFIILPQKAGEINLIKELMKTLNNYDLDRTEPSNRMMHVNGKELEKGKLYLFDTPSAWLAGLNNLSISSKLKEKDIDKLLKKMNGDMKSYTEANLKSEKYYQDLEYLSLPEFNKYFS